MSKRKSFREAKLLATADAWMTVFGMERVPKSSFEGLTFVLPRVRAQGWSEFLLMLQGYLECRFGTIATNSLVVSTTVGEFNFVVNCCVRHFNVAGTETKRFSCEKPN